MTNTTANTQYSSLAKSGTEVGTYVHGGIAVPVQLVLVCVTESDREGWERLEGTLSPCHAEGERSSTLPACVGDYGYSGMLTPHYQAFQSYFSSMCTMRLPASPQHLYLQILYDIMQIYNARESDLRHNIKESAFADHELIGMKLALDWEVPGAPYTIFGMREDDQPGITVDMLVKLFKDGEMAVLEDCEEEGAKADVEIYKALDAMAARSWKGHLVGVCVLEGKPRESPDGSEAEEGSDIFGGIDVARGGE
jgi:hypothetical protein